MANNQNIHTINYFCLWNIYIKKIAFKEFKLCLSQNLLHFILVYEYIYYKYTNITNYKLILNNNLFNNNNKKN